MSRSARKNEGSDIRCAPGRSELRAGRGVISDSRATPLPVPDKRELLRAGGVEFPGGDQPSPSFRPFPGSPAAPPALLFSASGFGRSPRGFDRHGVLGI